MLHMQKNKGKNRLLNSCSEQFVRTIWLKVEQLDAVVRDRRGSGWFVGIAEVKLISQTC
jgi:hypothetical protein